MEYKSPDYTPPVKTAENDKEKGKVVKKLK